MPHAHRKRSSGHRQMASGHRQEASAYRRCDTTTAGSTPLSVRARPTIAPHTSARATHPFVTARTPFMNSHFSSPIATDVRDGATFFRVLHHGDLARKDSIRPSRDV